MIRKIYEKATPDLEASLKGYLNFLVESQNMVT